MTYEADRATFIEQMHAEGMDREVARRILRWANTYQRLAVLDCNGDRRPYVSCPGESPCPHGVVPSPSLCAVCTPCLCDGRFWTPPGHEKIPPVVIEQARAERMIRAWCDKATDAFEARVETCKPDCPCKRPFVPIFSGDPRGACVKLRVPSGRTDDGGREGVCVPTRRY